MTPKERTEFINDVVEALAQAQSGQHETEHEWVKLAMQREAQSIAFRNAIIEKTILTLLGIAITGVIGLCIVVGKGYLTQIGLLKP